MSQNRRTTVTADPKKLAASVENNITSNLVWELPSSFCPWKLSGHNNLK
jgi:hypothetical protein